MKTVRELIDELSSTACRCGKNKRPRNTFCTGCYYSLPQPMPVALYHRVGQGYEEAYAAAAEFLDARKEAAAS